MSSGFAQNITAYRIANSILMKSRYTGAYLIVEGERDDMLFSKFIDRGNCVIEHAFGKTNVVDCIQILNSNGYFSALGIIDKDFSTIQSNSTIVPNVLYTDYHDAEIAILISPVFEYVISQHSNKKKLEEFQKKTPNIKEHFFELARPIGVLKLVNDTYDLGLCFKPEKPEGNNLSYHDFISRDDMQYISDDALINAVYNYSTNRRTNLKEKKVIVEKFNQHKANEFDLKELCNGHHIISITLLAFRRAIGNNKASRMSQIDLEERFLLSYESRYFQTTTLYSKIKLWENSASKKILSF